MTHHVQPLRRAVLAGTGVIAMALVTATGCGSQHIGHRTVRAESAASVGTVITIDPQVGDTFTPTSAAVPAMTASQAWAAFAQLSNTASAIPSGVTAQLGYFTLPKGPGLPGQYTADNQLVWGFSWHQCPSSSLGNLPPGNPCLGWLFLDANTGAEIDLTWQQ